MSPQSPEHRNDSAPWPYVRQTTAAKALGVTVEYLDGLANNPIPAHKVTTPKGHQFWLFEKAAVEKILVKAARPIPWNHQ